MQGIKPRFVSPCIKKPMDKREEERQNFCSNIRFLRQKYHLSQTQMCKLLHISIDTLRRIESGSIPPRLSGHVLRRLATLFPVSCYDLFAFRLEEREQNKAKKS